MNGIEVLDGILGTVGLQHGEEDNVVQETETGIHPISIKGRLLKLPTEKVLLAGDWDNVIPFQLFSENHLREGVSPPMQRLVDYYRQTFTVRALNLISFLAAVASNTKLQEQLTPDARLYLKNKDIAGIDDECFAKVVSIISNHKPTPGASMVNVKLMPSGKLGEQKFKRVCRVQSLPIRGITQADRTIKINGVTITRKAERRGILALIDYVIGAGINEDYFSAGTNSMHTPYLSVLMRATKKFSDHLNKISAPFLTFMKTNQSELEYSQYTAPIVYPDVNFDFETWAESYINEIPRLEECEGTVPVNEVSMVAEEPPRHATAGATAPPKMAPTSTAPVDTPPKFTDTPPIHNATPAPATKTLDAPPKFTMATSSPQPSGLPPKFSTGAAAAASTPAQGTKSMANDTLAGFFQQNGFVASQPQAVPGYQAPQSTRGGASGVQYTQNAQINTGPQGEKFMLLAADNQFYPANFAEARDPGYRYGWLYTNGQFVDESQLGFQHPSAIQQQPQVVYQQNQHVPPIAHYQQPQQQQVVYQQPVAYQQPQAQVGSATHGPNGEPKYSDQFGRPYYQDRYTGQAVFC